MRIIVCDCTLESMLFNPSRASLHPTHWSQSLIVEPPSVSSVTLSQAKVPTVWDTRIAIKYCYLVVVIVNVCINTRCTRRCKCIIPHSHVFLHVCILYHSPKVSRNLKGGDSYMALDIMI